MIGIPYKGRIPSFTASLTADDVLCTVTAPSTGVLLATRAWFAQVSNDDLNEVMSIEFVRCSFAGAGGASMTFDEPILAAAAFPGSGIAIDSDKWSSASDPLVTSTVDATPGAYNLANGWEWAAQSDDDLIVVPPSGIIGLRTLTASSGSMTWRGGISLLYIGS